jgi:hypothetical protein
MTELHSNQHVSSWPTGIRLPLLLIIAVLALSGCSSVKTKIDRGAIAARTFSFLNTGSKPLPAYAEARKEAHLAIQQALVNNLAAKGVALVPTGGDVTVAYLLIVGNNAETTSLNSYFGYSSDAEALVDKVHQEQAVGSKERNYFEAGTLVVDFLDPKTSKILQRRSIQAQVLRNLPAESRVARVQAIVDQALADVVISR